MSGFQRKGAPEGGVLGKFDDGLKEKADGESNGAIGTNATQFSFPRLRPARIPFVWWSLLSMSR